MTSLPAQAYDLMFPDVDRLGLPPEQKEKVVRLRDLLLPGLAAVEGKTGLVLDLQILKSGIDILEIRELGNGWVDTRSQQLFSMEEIERGFDRDLFAQRIADFCRGESA